MDYNSLDLRNKTIFDFTNDPAILGELVSTTDKETFLNGLTPIARAFSLIDYAEYIQDEKMIAAVEAEFHNELESFFNEQ